MKYLSAKKTVLILALNLTVACILWALPSVLENMLLQKIVVITFTAVGIVLAFLFFLVNGMSTTLTEGAYEKEYYTHLKSGTALDEGQNLRPNPFKLTLCKRIYYSKLLLLFLFPVIAVYLFECAAMLLEMLL
jgi:NADH:ubiquinone oxidoreductase subunit 3 (subunit A)